MELNGRVTVKSIGGDIVAPNIYVLNIQYKQQ